MTTRPKNIVLCSDGTGNTTMKGRGSNVFKLYEALDLQGNPPQIAFYDDGVGTQGFKPLKLMGGAFGWGLKGNVQQLYASLCRAYEPGDRIFLFGFSRGAYTVRTLAGLIIRCGILRVRDKARPLSEEELSRRIDAAYAGFRSHCRRFSGTRSVTQAAVRRGSRILPGDGASRSAGRPGEEPASHDRTPAERRTDEFRKTFAVHHPEHAPDGKVGIRFLGVWDTVSAVGTPIRELTVALNEIHPFWFQDLTLSKRVQKACHALAIDDERLTFHPEMWDERGETSDRIEQVWFAGVHSNVGGGYPQQGMSLVALDWMMTKAADQGLRFRESYRDRRNVHDRLYDSRSGLGVYYRYRPRDIAALCKEHGVAPKIHVSALQRIAWSTDGYAPGNLPDRLEIVSHGPASPSESATALRALKRHLENGGDGPGRPGRLSSVRRLVGARRHLHRALVGLTLAVMGLTFIEPWQGLPSLPEGLAKGLRAILGEVPLLGARLSRLIDLWPLAVLALLGFLLLLLRSRHARSKMASQFSAFWRERLEGPWDQTVYGLVATTAARVPQVTVSHQVPLVASVAADGEATTLTAFGERTGAESTTGDELGDQRRARRRGTA